MRIQKKDNSVECVICEDELLEKYHINMEDVARCSQKTNKLMRDICDKTQAFLDIEPPECIQLGVKIDMDNKCVVVVGKSANTDNVSQFAPELSEHVLEESDSSGSVKEGVRGYVFDSMRDVMEACHVLPKNQMFSCLIKGRDYILILDNVPSELMEKVTYCMCEFSKETTLFDSMNEVRMKDVLISSGAVEKLAI